MANFFGSSGIELLLVTCFFGVRFGDQTRARDRCYTGGVYQQKYKKKITNTTLIKLLLLDHMYLVEFFRACYQANEVVLKIDFVIPWEFITAQKNVADRSHQNKPSI